MRFAFLQDNNAILEVTTIEILAVKFYPLPRKGGILILNLVSRHLVTALCKTPAWFIPQARVLKALLGQLGFLYAASLSVSSADVSTRARR
jgi:hypothetical protein